MLVGFVGAAIVKTYLYPQVATLAATPTVSIMIEEQEYVNGSTIDWGIMTQANTTYLMAMNITNIGAVPCNVTFTTSGLPVNWTQTWLADGTVLTVDEWVSADIELTTGFTDGNYTWNSYIHLEKVA